MRRTCANELLSRKRLKTTRTLCRRSSSRARSPETACIYGAPSLIPRTMVNFRNCHARAPRRVRPRTTVLTANICGSMLIHSLRSQHACAHATPLLDVTMEWPHHESKQHEKQTIRKKTTPKQTIPKQTQCTQHPLNLTCDGWLYPNVTVKRTKRAA